MKPLRTILAVLLGYVALLAVELAGALVFHDIVGSEFMSFVSGVAAGALTARIAVERPLMHAVVLGVVVISVTVVGAAFSKRPAIAGIPPWYPYAAALLAGAGTFVGGALATREQAVR